MGFSRHEFSSNILAQLQRNQQRVFQSTPEINSDGYIVLTDGVLAQGAGGLLRSIATQPKLLKSKIEKIGRKDTLLALVKETATENGNTALHCAAATPESFQMLLEIYPPHECIEAVALKNFRGQTVLHEAIGNPDSLGMVLSLYANNIQRLIAAQEKNADNNTALHLAAAHPESFQMLWALYPQAQQFSALEQKNNKGETVLHLALISPRTTPAFLKELLQSYPAKTLLPAIKADGAKILSLALNRPELLKIIVESFSQKELLLALQETKFGVSFLDWHRKSKNLPIILEKLSDSDRLALVVNRNANDKNLLDELGADLRALRSVLKSFPVANTWMVEHKDGPLDLLPIFKTENPNKKIAEILILYNNIKQLEDCGNASAIILANNLIKLLDEYIAKKGTHPERESQMREEFSTEVKQGYKSLSTHGNFIGAILINIALAATLVGIPIVIGKLFLTGYGFFAQTSAQKITCSIEAAFNEAAGKENPAIPCSQGIAV